MPSTDRVGVVVQIFIRIFIKCENKQSDVSFTEFLGSINANVIRRNDELFAKTAYK